MVQNMKINNIIELIKESLTDDLLKSRYLKKNRNRYTGHCYVATETLYHLMTEDEQKKYKPAILKLNNDTHWFLINIDNGKVLDITAEQFDFDLPYKNAKRSGFLTKTPSKRSLILINRIYEKISC
jgi:hypothetical protein